jgi:hypothetical protein
MKQILHVAQDAIRRNTKEGTNDPAIIVRDYKGAERAHEVALMVEGREVGRFVYRPHKPLSCGARLWLEVDTHLLTLVPTEPDHEENPSPSSELPIACVV